MMSEQGTKFDDCKPRIDLVPPAAISLIGEVSRHGAEKYGEGNCEQGFKYSRLTGAALRHVNAWQAGQDLDPESGLPHLAHAAWNLMRLIDQQYWGYGEDDRTNRWKAHKAAKDSAVATFSESDVQHLLAIAEVIRSDRIADVDELGKPITAEDMMRIHAKLKERMYENA